MENFTITSNRKFNSIEISFDVKPCEGVRSILKSFSFRWNPARSIWYGFADLEEVRAALLGAGTSKKMPPKNDSICSIWERTRATIPEHNRHEATKEVARATREYFKRNFPELKISCRCGSGGWAAHNEVIFELKSGPYKKDSDIFNSIIEFVKKWLWSFNYDNSDSMTDYFDRNFYEEIEHYSYIETEPNEAQTIDIENFYNELEKFRAEEEKRKEEEYKKIMKEREELAKAAEERAKIIEAQKTEILSNIIIKDIEECKKYILTGCMICGIGKECNIEEVKKEGHIKEESALIKREIHFNNENVYNNFCNMFMCDFDFLHGFGGTGTLDDRVSDKNYNRLNRTQRESVKWLLWDCVAVYLFDELKLIIDPEGYNYARYVNIINGECAKKYLKDEEKAEEQRKKSAFFFPSSILEQSKNISIGEKYTLINIDPWSMCVRIKHITVTESRPTNYAQYNDALYLRFYEKNHRKPDSLFIYGNSTAIFCGWLPPVPEELTRKKISSNFYEVLNAGENADNFIVAASKYYKSQGFNVALSTLQY